MTPDPAADSGSRLRVVLSQQQIAARVREMGQQIARDFVGESVLLVGVLKGAAVFLSDLARAVPLDASFDFIGTSSYGAEKVSSGEVRLTKDLEQPLIGRNVVLVEDILDTGLTMMYLRQIFLARQPKALKIAALLDKACRRQHQVVADYVGFVIPDEFVVGYGMDYSEKYRNLPDICVLEEQ